MTALVSVTYDSEVQFSQFFLSDVSSRRPINVFRLNDAPAQQIVAGFIHGQSNIIDCAGDLNYVAFHLKATTYFTTITKQAVPL